MPNIDFSGVENVNDLASKLEAGFKSMGDFVQQSVGHSAESLNTKVVEVEQKTLQKEINNYASSHPLFKETVIDNKHPELLNDVNTFFAASGDIDGAWKKALKANDKSEKAAKPTKSDDTVPNIPSISSRDSIDSNEVDTRKAHKSTQEAASNNLERVLSEKGLSLSDLGE